EAIDHGCIKRRPSAVDNVNGFAQSGGHVFSFDATVINCFERYRFIDVDFADLSVNSRGLIAAENRWKSTPFVSRQSRLR
ncbi:MAG TPA: hypothetical protein PLJ65_11025, partial [Casimicrobium sp.]|nr:hypothetical protein [Casimicrobium sp.]